MIDDEGDHDREGDGEGDGEGEGEGEGDEDLDDRTALERIVEDGDSLFTHSWDSGGLGGGGGMESIRELNGQFAMSSLDIGSEGPYATFDEALAAFGVLTVTSASTSIWRSLMTAEELAKRLECDEDGFELEINSEPWVYRAATGAFERATAPSQPSGE
jgi:hypothetical protein